MLNQIEQIRQQIINHPANVAFTNLGWDPIFTAHPKAKILLISQAPGLKTQLLKAPFHDASGDRLRSWLAVDEAQFYNPELFAFLPLDFYFPGKANRGDLPPRPEFAPLWHPLLIDCLPDIKLTILIGSYAINYYLKQAGYQNATAYIKKYQDFLPTYFPIVHPSPLTGPWLKQNPWFLTDNIPVLQTKIKALII